MPIICSSFMGDVWRRCSERNNGGKVRGERRRARPDGFQRRFAFNRLLRQKSRSTQLRLDPESHFPSSFSATASRGLLASLFLRLLRRFLLCGFLLFRLRRSFLLSCLLGRFFLRRFFGGDLLRGRFRPATTTANRRRCGYRRFRTHFGVGYAGQFCFLFFLFFFVIFFQRFAIGAA